MIETKEQYEALTRDEYVGPIRDMAETIEALREVARAAEPALGYAAGWKHFPNDSPMKLMDALDALPDWLTDD